MPLGELIRLDLSVLQKGEPPDPKIMALLRPKVPDRTCLVARAAVGPSEESGIVYCVAHVTRQSNPSMWARLPSIPEGMPDPEELRGPLRAKQLIRRPGPNGLELLYHPNERMTSWTL
jgi:hypothetical protein